MSIAENRTVLMDSALVDATLDLEWRRALLQWTWIVGAVMGG